MYMLQAYFEDITGSKNTLSKQRLDQIQQGKEPLEYGILKLAKATGLGIKISTTLFYANELQVSAAVNELLKSFVLYPLFALKTAFRLLFIVID